MPTTVDLSTELGTLSQTNLRDPQSVYLGGMAMEHLLLGNSATTPEVVSTLGAEALTGLQDLYEQFETNMEYDFADRILQGMAQIEDYPLYDRFTRLIDAESALAAIKTNHTLLFILN